MTTSPVRHHRKQSFAFRIEPMTAGVFLMIASSLMDG
jgi:hypothetical protein